jgi:hypothetical protein
MVEMCYNGQISCPYSNHPAYETVETTCDGLDNDCDGMTDEDLIGTPCPMQDGVCSGSRQVCDGPSGFEVCEYMTYYNYNSSYQDVETTCDGLDNDCDGMIDDNLTGSLCPLQDGVCSGSRQVCDGINGWQSCGLTGYTNWNMNYQTTETICDGLDNDCDQLVDEELIGALCPLQDGVCSGSRQLCGGAGGFQTCDSATYEAYISPYYEEIEITCDGLDNDCDGLIDEGLAGDLCPLQAGVCSGTVETCSGGQSVCDYPDYETTEATCDGLDNDCDGQVDENLGGNLCPYQSGVCAGATDVCSGGQLTCDYAAHSPYYEGGQEVTCDGLDNDCDGVADDGCTGG